MQSASLRRKQFNPHTLDDSLEEFKPSLNSQFMGDTGNFQRIMSSSQNKFMYTDENILIEEPSKLSSIICKDIIGSTIGFSSKGYEVSKDSLEELGEHESRGFKDSFDKSDSKLPTLVFNDFQSLESKISLPNLYRTNSMGLSQLSDCPEMLKTGILYGKTYTENRMIEEDNINLLNKIEQAKQANRIKLRKLAKIKAANLAKREVFTDITSELAQI